MDQCQCHLIFSKHLFDGILEDHGSMLLLVVKEHSQYGSDLMQPYHYIFVLECVGDYYLENKVPQRSE